MITDLVNVITSDGIRLDGTLRKPAKEGSSTLGVDIVILLHGVGGNFYGPGMFEEYSDALLEEGCAVLRVNNRGHDPMSRANIGGEGVRLGAAYESVDACKQDWEAWISFADGAGYRRIGVWGHSLGATKSIYYMATNGDTRVQCVVAGSPPRFSNSAYQELEEADEFNKSCSEAQKLVAQGQGETLMEIEYPTPLLLTAQVFLDKYGPDARYDILEHIPNVAVPMLIMIGTEEAQTMTAFKGLPSKVEKLAGELEHLTFESIPGADHFYTHQREHVWGVVSRWLSKH